VTALDARRRLGTAYGQKDQSRALFSLRATVAIVIILLIPLGVRVFTNTEPFPAMLFPAGGSSALIVNNQISFQETVLVGYTEKGDPFVLSPVDIIRVMPDLASYFQYVASRDFGQSTDTTVNITIKGLHKTITVPRHVPSDAARSQARAWMRSRLQRLGLSSAKVTVRTESITVDYKSGRQVSSKVTDDHLIALQ
jgi:hypothetical protein